MCDAGDPLLCPSARPECDGAVIIGVVTGTVTRPRVMPTDQPLPATPELLALAEPASPTEVFRFAAPCHGERCGNFASGTCRLIERGVRILAPVSETPPPCRIRPRCRWWAQEGIAACRRCPQIVTERYDVSPEMLDVAYGDSRPPA